MTQLGDLEHLLGTVVQLAQGSLAATIDMIPDHERTRLHADVKAADVTFAAISGSLHVSGEGFTDAFPFQLEAELPKLRSGAAASLSATARLNLDGHELLAVARTGPLSWPGNRPEVAGSSHVRQRHRRGCT